MRWDRERGPTPRSDGHCSSCCERLAVPNPAVATKLRWDSRANSLFAARKMPWRARGKALHVWRGFAAEQSTVTVVGATGTIEVVVADSVDAEGVLTTMAHSMTIAGNLGRDSLAGQRRAVAVGGAGTRRDHGADAQPPAGTGFSVRARPVAGRGTGAGSGGAPAGNFGDGIDSRAMPGGHHAGGAGRVGSQIHLRADVGRRHTGCNPGR